MRKFYQSVMLSAALCFGAGTAIAGSDHHWGYEGHEGPMHWGDISHDYHMCKDGKQQSPIDIRGATPKALDAIGFSYTASPKNIVNNGHTIQVNMKPGSTITVGGKTYKLLQFHFHSPSEHKIDGKPADMVAHFVHQADDGQLGVVAVLFKKGKANPIIGKLWKKMPKNHGGNADLAGMSLSVADLLPGNRAYYNYSGSLTTPPCSEGVNWMVLKSPVNVSAAQVKAFTDIFPKSVRPTQPLHGREIHMVK
ncbi:MAG TPA: carbonic anhydrase family protein [Gammaproteobacteria bacterium]|nr:carbonic anhydrase family protein [Gammaproteobacteria bacterium]